MWTSCIAGLGCVVGGCLMLPSLARDEMRDTAAVTLRSIGVAISGYGLCSEMRHGDCSHRHAVAWTAATSVHEIMAKSCIREANVCDAAEFMVCSSD